MKLSKKGLKSFDKQMTEIVLDNNFEKWDRFSAIRQVKFEPGDLEDCVMLTVKEAKEILQSSYDVLSWSMVGPTHRDNALYVQSLLKYKIDQAEKSQ